MGLFTCLVNFIARAFRNGAQALLTLTLLYFSIHFFTSLRHITTHSLALQSRFITLCDLPTDYVQSLNESINKDLLFTFNTTDFPTQIPPIIHQTYKTEAIPSRWQYSHNSCKKHNPGYTHMFCPSCLPRYDMLLSSEVRSLARDLVEHRTLGCATGGSHETNSSILMTRVNT